MNHSRVGGVLVELVRVSTAEHRRAAVELHAHQAVDHRGGDEVIMAVDAAVDHQAEGDDGVVVAGLGQAARQQRDLEGAGHVECSTTASAATPLQPSSATKASRA